MIKLVFEDIIQKESLTNEIIPSPLQQRIKITNFILQIF